MSPAGERTRDGAARPTPPAADTLLGLLLIAAVFAAYAPALAGDLLWDDAAHITVGALQGWDGLVRIWFAPGATQQYYPVLHSAFWVEHRLWGSSVLGYHLIMAALHALAACLVVLLCQRLAVRGAWIAGFLFALHPVHVESVAWISEQKNTLSLVLALLSVLAWLRFDETRARRHWIVAFLLFALALGAKTVTATVPCALLVLVWWRRGSIAWRRDAVPLLPWIVLGIASGLGTAWVERHVIGAAGLEFTLSPVQRLLLAGRAVWHYLGTFLWPAHLVFTYPRWRIEPGTVLAWAYPAALLVLVAALWRARHRTRAPLAALLVFAGTLFPVLGFLDVYPFRYSFVADHFQYHADVVLCMLAGGGIAWLSARAHSATQRRAVSLALGGLALTLAALTWREARNYRNAESLYRAILERNPASWMAHHNLGRLVARKAGGLAEAIAHFEAAIALKPDHARAHYSLGVALQRVGRAAESVAHFEAAIRLEPDNPELVANAHYIAGDILRRDPTWLDEAIAHLREAVRLKPKVAQGHNTLGEALLAHGRTDDARREFAEALRLQPDFEEAQANLARVSGPASGRGRWPAGVPRVICKRQAGDHHIGVVNEAPAVSAVERLQLALTHCFGLVERGHDGAVDGARDLAVLHRQRDLLRHRRADARCLVDRGMRRAAASAKAERRRAKAAHDVRAVAVRGAVEQRRLVRAEVVAGDDDAVRVRMVVEVLVLGLAERRLHGVVAARRSSGLPVRRRRAGGDVIALPLGSELGRVDGHAVLGFIGIHLAGPALGGDAAAGDGAGHFITLCGGLGGEAGEREHGNNGRDARGADHGGDS